MQKGAGAKDFMNTATTESVIGKFTIEADHQRNGQMIIQCIPGCVLRSRLDSSRTVIDAKTGEEMVPKDQARALSELPKLPGMQSLSYKT